MRESLTVGQRSMRGRRGLSLLPLASLIVIAAGGGPALAARPGAAARSINSNEPDGQKGGVPCVVLRPHFRPTYLPLLPRGGITKERVALDVRLYQMPYLNRVVKAVAEAKTHAKKKEKNRLCGTLEQLKKMLNDAHHSFAEGKAVREKFKISDPRAHNAANALQVSQGNLAVVKLTLAGIGGDAQGADGVTGGAGGEEVWAKLEEGLELAHRAAADALRGLSGHERGGKTVLASEVTSVVENYAFQAKKRNVKVTCNLRAGGDVEVPGSSGEWREVLGNLFANVFRHAGHNVKQVLIRLNPSDTGVRLTFEDDGQGIPQENREKIWQPRFTTSDMGEGLGLANVKSFIEELGGTVTVEPPASQDPTGAPQDQTGARFVFDIPLNRQ